MAELAKDYQENLQLAGIDDENETARKARIEDALTYIPETQLLEDLLQTEMSWKVKRIHVKKAISLSKNGSSTGIDGCPYELWKQWKVLSEKHQINT